MDKKLISEAVDGFELLDIYLYSSSISRFKNITSNCFPKNMNQQNKLSINAEFLESNENEKIENIMHAKVSLGFRYIVEKDENNVLAELDSCFLAKYKQNKKISEAAIEEFMKYNVVHNVWPFWREHAFNLSIKANLPKPIISLFKPPVKAK